MSNWNSEHWITSIEFKRVIELRMRRLEFVACSSSCRTRSLAHLDWMKMRPGRGSSISSNSLPPFHPRLPPSLPPTAFLPSFLPSQSSTSPVENTSKMTTAWEETGTPSPHRNRNRNRNIGTEREKQASSLARSLDG